MEKSDEHEVAVDPTKRFFPRRNLIKHQVQYHVPNLQKKVFFPRKMKTKHEQNVVKSGLNTILPAEDVKMR